jgi:hypothetical protein
VATLAAYTLRADEGLPASQGLGVEVAALGDLDGDGLPELGLSSDGGAGALWLLSAPASGPVTAAAAQLVLGDSAELGEGLLGAASAADLDCDGRPDLLLAAPSAAAEAGKVFVFRDVARRADLGLADADATLLGKLPGDLFGAAVASADLNGDGCDDLAVGAAGVDAGSSPDWGGVFVWFGRGW